MQREITIHLDNESNAYRLHEDAYNALGRYLDQASARLTGDPDRSEVMGDLERSIGAKLTERLGLEDRLLTLEDITAVLEAMGPVGPVGIADDQAVGGSDRPRRRRLYRIRDRQQIAGVCTGLAAYSEIRIDWVRTVFVLLTVGTAGAFALVYLVLAFVLPVAASREAWVAQLNAEQGR